MRIVSRRRLTILALITAACSSSIEPWFVAPVPAHDVLLTASDSGTTSEGRIILVMLQNSATTAAYFRNCGGPALGMQVFDSGSWHLLAGPAVLCVAGPPTVELAPGGEMTIRRVLAVSGHYRFALGVSTTTDLRDEAVATSNSFTMP